MERDLEGKVALVTGGSRGIGRAIALSLAKRGADLVVGYLRKKSAAEESVAAIEAEGGKAVAVKAHMGEEDQIAGLFKDVGERFGRLDVFVANAATGVWRPVQELDERAWDWTMDANARSLLLGARHARELMVDGGSMIALSSIGSVRVLPNYAVIGVSKAAVESLVRYLAVEFAPFGIRVNTISAGLVDTDALKGSPIRDEMIATAENETPAGRLVTPEDVANAVDFLTSERASMITGHTLVVDGGAGLPA